MSILSDIIARKTAEIESCASGTVTSSQKRPFVSSFKRKHPSLIAEIKPISPIQGRLMNSENISAMVDIYQYHAQAISVLCDKATFGGGFDLLALVRAQTDLPLLAKDFIIDHRQIDAAAAHGADAVLLIAALLSNERLLYFSKQAMAMGMDVFLELHEPSEIDAAALLIQSLRGEERTHIVLGINNRNLHTQSIDLNTTKRLGKLIRQRFSRDIPLISESGIAHRSDVLALSPYVQGFLIGSALLKSEDPDRLLHSLFLRS